MTIVNRFQNKQDVLKFLQNYPDKNEIITLDLLIKNWFQHTEANLTVQSILDFLLGIDTDSKNFVITFK